MKSQLTQTCFVLIAVLTAVPTSGLAAEFTQVRAGYEGQARVGVWLPVRVSAHGLKTGRTVSLTTKSLDPRGNPFIRTCGSAVVDPEGHVAVAGLTLVGRMDAQLRVDLVDLSDTDNSTPLCSTVIQCSQHAAPPSDAPVQESLRLYRHDVRFLLTIGQPAGIDELLRQAAEYSPDSPVIVGVSVEADDELPTEQKGYDLFSTIVFTGHVELTDEQFQALRMWIHGGGRLIISWSGGGGDLLATRLGQWLHARFDLSPQTHQVTDTDLGALQQIVPRSTRVSTYRRTVRMIQVRSREPFWLAESTKGPLAARISSGGGQVTLVTLDLSRKPLSQWNSLAEFYAVLILGAPLSKAGGGSASARISSSGVSDLSTQLMATIDPVPQSGRWTTWSVMAIAFVWLVVIGPLDYFIVVVLLKRPHFTWFTFPVWVITGFAVLYSFKSVPSDVVLNSVHLVDVAPDRDLHSVQALSLMSVSAPRTSRADLRADAAFDGLDPGVTLTWAGRPEDVYGGMYRTTGIGASDQAYSCRADLPSTLSSVPLLTDGSFESQAQWSAQSPKPLAESSLNVSGFGILGGAFEHHLPLTIHDWFVVYGNRIYRARDDARKSLPSGQSWSFRSAGTQILDLKSWLAGQRDLKTPPPKRAVGRSTETVPYNVRGQDPLDIVTMMSLYRTAGAEGYSGLHHGALRRLDMSETIRMNNAIVIGWSKTPATHLQMGGSRLPETSSMTIVRLLLPVDRRPADPTAVSEEELMDEDRRQQEAAKTNNSDNSSPDKTN